MLADAHPATLPEESLVKGTCILGALSAVERAHGKAGLRATLDAALPDIRQTLDFGHVVSVGWYPIRLYREVLAAARRGLNEDDLLPFRLSRDATSHDFNGIFKVVIRALRPLTTFKHAQRLMTLYYKGGTVQTLESRAGYGRVRFTGWSGFDRNVWLDVQGGMAGVQEVSGAKNVYVRVLSGGLDGSDDLDAEVRWGADAP